MSSVQEERITAFLARIEGETLGRMLDYLSTELTHALLTPKVSAEMNKKNLLSKKSI